MAHYKQLNSELIGKLQEYKLILRAYEKEMIELRKQVIEERSSRVEMQQKFLSTLACKFVEVLRQVDSNVDVIHLLQEADAVDSGGGRNYSRATETKRNSTENTTRRPSMESMVQELRYSNGARSRSSTFYTKSPVVRRSSHSSQLNRSSKSKTDSLRQSAELDESERSLEVEIDEEDDETIVRVQAEEDITTEKVHVQLDNIIEVSAIEKDLSTCTEELDTEVEVERVADRAVGKRSARALHDISNQQKTQESICDPVPVESCSHLRQHYSSPGSLKPPKGRVVVQRGKQRHNARNVLSGSSEDSLGCRTKVKIKDVSRRSALLTDSSDDSSKENDLSGRILDNCVSSTPRVAQNITQHKSLLKFSLNESCSNAVTSAATITTSAIGVNTNTSSNITNLDSNTSCRPRRRCAPKSLVEPSLHTKLRNQDKGLGKKKKVNQINN